MKIHQLLKGPSIAITNEEKDFIDAHSERISLHSLNEHEIWLAQNLVRKQVYVLTKDNRYIVINKSNESKNPSI